MKILDFHVHYGKDNFDFAENSIENIKKELKKSKTNFVVLFPFSTTNLLLDSLKILNLSKKYKFIIPFFRVNPNKISKIEFENNVKHFYGLKLYPDKNFNPSSKKYFWIYEICNNFDIPIIFHSKNNSKNGNCRNIIKINNYFPNLKIVIAHFCDCELKELEFALSKNNVFIDTSLFLTTKRFEYLVNKYGSNKFIFGSDFPYDSQKIAKDKIIYSNISKKDKENVLFNNANNLISFF